VVLPLLLEDHVQTRERGLPASGVMRILGIYSAADRVGCLLSSALARRMVPPLSPCISVASSSSVVYR